MKSNQNDRSINSYQNLSRQFDGLDGFDAKTYELLSAYIDGEVTPEERRQVHHRLDNDRQYKAAYLQMMQLRSHLQSIPAPKTTQSVKELARAVFKRVDHRTNLMVVSGGGAIAALFLAVLATWIPQGGSRSTLLAQFNRVESEPLQIALNEPLLPIVNPEAASVTVDQPLILIPKAPVSQP